MNQLDRHSFPPHGWTFLQAQTGWRNPMAMVGFDASVKAIIKHRQSNPVITSKHKLATYYDDVADELENYTRIRLGMPSARAPSFFQRSRSQSPGAGAAAAEDNWVRRITRLGTGVATNRAWLGEGGKPVAQELAEQRATICETCPQNKPGDWLSLFVKPVANLLKAQVEERNRMKLQTSKDDKLGMCDACGCPLHLKIHVPLKFIKEHMQKPEADKLDPRCWIRHET